MKPRIKTSNVSKRPRRSSGLLSMIEARSYKITLLTKLRRMTKSKYICIIGTKGKHERFK